MIRVIPEELHVSTKWDDVIDFSGYHFLTFLHAVAAEHILHTMQVGS